MKKGRTLFLIAFLSGFVALLYQIVWIYQIQTFVGVSAYAVATVFAVFFLGLALGSYAGGRFIDRIHSVRGLLRIYCFLGLILALYSLLITWLLSLTSVLLSGAYGASFFGFLRFISVSAILLIPTTLIGATFPLLVKVFVASDRSLIKKGVGLMYALNTLGGSAGVLLTGFLLIRVFGIQATTLIGSGLIVLSVYIAYRLRTIYGDVQVVGVKESGERFDRHELILMMLFFTTGFTALALELVWTRLFSLYFFGTLYATTIMLTVLLAGLGIGGIAYTHLNRLHHNPIQWFGWMQILLVVSATIGLYVFTQLETSLAGGFYAHIPTLFLTGILLLFIPSLCYGFSFPLLGAYVVARSRYVGRSSGRVYAANTLGGIVGSLVGGFLLIPSLGIRGAFVTLLAIALVAGLVGFLNGRVSKKIVAGLVIGGLSILFIVNALPSSFISVKEGYDVVYSGHGPTGTVSVVRGMSGEREGVVFSRLFVDNQLVAADTPVLALDSKILAHLPLLLHDNPQRVATVGLGSGGTAYSMLLHPEVTQVDALEIEPRVVEAAAYFETLNAGALDDERLEIIVDDARAYFTLSDAMYDVIVTDVTNLKYKRNANLYTKEYFELLQSRVGDGGIVAAWVPISDVTMEEQEILMRTFSEVFDEMYVWYPYHKLSHFYVFIGVDEPLEIRYSDFLQRLDEVRDDAVLVDLNSRTLLNGMILDSTAVQSYVGEGSVHTDDYPILAFPSDQLRPESFGENLASVLNRKKSVLPYITGLNSYDRGVLLYEQEAVRANLLEGHIALLQGETQKAALAYKTAIDNADYLVRVDVG